jgi:hypothetical protein
MLASDKNNRQTCEATNMTLQAIRPRIVSGHTTQPSFRTSLLEPLVLLHLVEIVLGPSTQGILLPVAEHSPVAKILLSSISAILQRCMLSLISYQVICARIASEERKFRMNTMVTCKQPKS